MTEMASTLTKAAHRDRLPPHAERNGKLLIEMIKK